MHMMKRLFLTLSLAAMPAAAFAAAPAPVPGSSAAEAGPVPAVNPAAAAAARGANPSATPPQVDVSTAGEDAAAAPTYDHARPTEGIGQPVARGWDFQPQVTDNGRYAHWFNNAILLPLMAIVSLFVLALMLWIVTRYRARANPTPSKTTHNTMIEVIWTLVPVLILIAIAVPSIDLLAKQYAPPPRDALTIKVTGYQWYWGYEYPDQEIPELTSRMLDEETARARGEPFQLAVDERMVVPVGRTVKLIVTGSDVIHSWAVPALWTKMDAVPGRLNEVTFRADRIGVYYGQCSELCGIDHAFMPIAVEVVSEADFARWVASKGGNVAAIRSGSVTPNVATAGANDDANSPSVAVEVPGAAATQPMLPKSGSAATAGAAPGAPAGETVTDQR